jgi:hypothetical protein
MEFTLSASQVSGLWRETALRTPFLWSSILLLAECGRRWHELMELMIKLSIYTSLRIRYRSRPTSHRRFDAHQTPRTITADLVLVIGFSRFPLTRPLFEGIRQRWYSEGCYNRLSFRLIRVYLHVRIVVSPFTTTRT